jgi:hypothetical protein
MTGLEVNSKIHEILRSTPEVLGLRVKTGKLYVPNEYYVSWTSVCRQPIRYTNFYILPDEEEFFNMELGEVQEHDHLKEYQVLDLEQSISMAKEYLEC